MSQDRNKEEISKLISRHGSEEGVSGSDSKFSSRNSPVCVDESKNVLVVSTARNKVRNNFFLIWCYGQVHKSYQSSSRWYHQLSVRTNLRKMNQKYNQEMLGFWVCVKGGPGIRISAYLVGPGIWKAKNMLICEPISEVLLTKTKTNLWQVSSDCELWRRKFRQRIISSVVLCLRKPRAIKISSVVLDCRLIAWGRGAHSMGAFGIRPGLGSLKFESRIRCEIQHSSLIGCKSLPGAAAATRIGRARCPSSRRWLSTELAAPSRAAVAFMTTVGW